MARKKVFGFNKKQDFIRTRNAVKTIETMHRAGARNRRKYPLGGGRAGGVEIRFEVDSVNTAASPKSAVVTVLATDSNRTKVPQQDESNQLTVYDKAGCYLSEGASLIGKQGYARLMHDVGDSTAQWEVNQICPP